MADESTIIVRTNADKWAAHLDGAPDLAFGENSLVKAVRRLLEGIEAEPAVFTILNQGDGSDDERRCSVVWDPPELLFPCQTCEGRGEYVGLIESEVCRGCGGRKVVPV